MRFSAFWGLNLRTKECVFHSRKCSFQFTSHTINSYKQWTNDEKQILCKPVRNFWKNDWNIAFTWLKHNVKPVGLLFKLVASSFCKKVADLYEQRSRRVSSAVGAYWNHCAHREKLPFKSLGLIHLCERFLIWWLISESFMKGIEQKMFQNKLQQCWSKYVLHFILLVFNYR